MSYCYMPTKLVKIWNDNAKFWIGNEAIGTLKQCWCEFKLVNWKSACHSQAIPQLCQYLCVCILCIYTHLYEYKYVYMNIYVHTKKVCTENACTRMFIEAYF